MDVTLSNKQVSGDRITLRTTDPRHIGGTGSRNQGEPKSGDFGRVLMDGLNKVNSVQQESLRLSQQMITDPDSVDVHDVTISLAEANMALNITKAVLDRVVRAYRDITSAR
jgi:flagellar hook-basal body complex protein FliE